MAWNFVGGVPLFGPSMGLCLNFMCIGYACRPLEPIKGL